jgi:hypothetical protein
VAEVIDATARRGGAPLHLIGHSSGGLDVRLLTAPGVGLPTAVDLERLAARVRTVVTVATPHHGTPLASFFTTLQGQQLLQLLSLNTIYVLEFGYLPLSALLWMASLAVRFGGFVANSQVLDELFGRLLEDFTVGRRRAVRALLRDVVRDQALMLQLTPEAMEVFNASVLQRRASATERSCAGGAPEPALDARRGARSGGAGDARPLRRAPPDHRGGAGARRAATRGPPGTRTATRLPGDALPGRERRHRADALPGLGARPPRCVADHLDVLGHFRDAAHAPPHVDWLVTGSGFDRLRFEALWADVAHFLVGGVPSRPKRRRREGRPTVARTQGPTKGRRHSRLL